MFKYYFYLCRPQTKNCPLNGNSRAEEKATAVWLCQTILQGKIKHNAHALCFAVYVRQNLVFRAIFESVSNEKVTNDFSISVSFALF